MVIADIEDYPISISQTFYYLLRQFAADSQERSEETTLVLYLPVSESNTLRLSAFSTVKAGQQEHHK